MWLIDAEALKDSIEHSLNTGRETFPAEIIYEAIDEQPTAYDVDKVVAELEKELKRANEEKLRCVKENPLQFDSAKGYTNGITVAIQIVKGGGVGNDSRRKFTEIKRFREDS